MEVEKGWSGGGESKQTSWKHVANLGTKFEGQITKYQLQKEESLVKVIGSQTMEHKNGKKTSSSGPISILRMVNQSESPLELEYELKGSMKSSEGWASQDTSYHISFKVDDNMDLWSWIWVYAGSWGSVTYAKTTVKIDSVEFVI
ncbi:hypothetical protein STIUS_v1c05290 [Spiroplasma sp. TIUS-1]|uniref:hypothetical protein n=1 Tax=Spiroplasma sp. TIUS-1 TaxID=216963 RepID=UPI001396E98B|nr:hypothetical protein [Spiroplasma sp. TIUS-1]QHX36083.1 hypothetical protein STIUS_v1c05290 [Spiroplasma sp. TIUS-1]